MGAFTSIACVFLVCVLSLTLSSVHAVALVYAYVCVFLFPWWREK